MNTPGNTWGRAAVLIFAIAPAWGHAMPRPPSAMTLAEFKPGRKVEMLKGIDVHVPAILRMLHRFPSLVVEEKSVRLLTDRRSEQPTCIVSGLQLDPALPDRIRIPEGGLIEITSVEMGGKPSSVFSGYGVRFTAQVVGTQMHADFQCYSGKDPKRAMSIDLFERMMRGKIRVLETASSTGRLASTSASGPSGTPSSKPAHSAGRKRSGRIE